MELSHFESLYPENSRFAEIEKILSFIKEGNSCQLISLPGAGRLNLFGLLTYNTKIRLKHLGTSQKWFHFVYLNFSEVKEKSLADITKFILIGILDSLRERQKNEEYKVVSKIFKESLEFNDELVLFQGLKKTIDYLAIERELNIIFLFDRFETYVPSLTNNFFTNLKILRNRAKYRFSCVFSSNRPLEDMLEPDLMSDFYEFVTGHVIYLPILDKPSVDFRLSYLEKIKNKKMDKKTYDSILKFTAGHGKLTRICLELAFADKDKKYDIDFFLSQKSVIGALNEIQKSLIPSEQKILQETHSTSFGSAKDKSSGQANPNNQHLEKIGLLKNGEITIPLFAEFIKKFKPKKEISLNELSEDLTSLEFKLLKFLIENQNKILIREEVVNGVWTELKSQEGVTDQALDQLISRLRKKIEDNPNSPTHLQTIKGRGFKFQS